MRMRIRLFFSPVVPSPHMRYIIAMGFWKKVIGVSTVVLLASLVWQWSCSVNTKGTVTQYVYADRVLIVLLSNRHCY